MNSSFSDDLLNRWNTAQWDLWDNLATALPTFQPPEDLNLWRESYVNSLSAWETAVRQALEAQKMWLQQWEVTMTLAVPRGTDAATWQRQVHEVTDHWLANQSRLWDQWFLMLKAESFANAPVVAPTPSVAKTAAVEPEISVVAKTTAVEPGMSVVAEAAAVEPEISVVAKTAAVEPEIEVVAEAAAVEPEIEVVAETAAVESETEVVAEAAVESAVETAAIADAETDGEAADFEMEADNDDDGVMIAKSGDEGDNLLAIRGVGPKIAQQLQEYGITRYRQLAQLDSMGLSRLEGHLRTRGVKSVSRLLQEKWVNQARALHQSKYGEPL